MDKWHEPGKPTNRLMPIGWELPLHKQEISFQDQAVTRSFMLCAIQFAKLSRRARELGKMFDEEIRRDGEGEEWKR